MREINAQITAKTVHQISDIKRVERARRRAHNKAIGERTIKIISSGLMALTLLLTGVKNVSAKYVLVEPPRYQANLLTDFMITKIVPSTGVIEATERLLPGHDYHNIYHINLAFGSDPSDYELSQLAYDNRAGDTTIFNKNAIYGGIWIDGQAEDISKDYRNRGGVISQNDTGRMYFIAVYSDFKVDYGRVDYSRCIKSSVFISGEATECRVEATGEGKIQYQPYTADGVRVEIPEAEDIELSALTDRFIYESGDWPAEYEWVEDEPEPDNNGSSGENLDTNTKVATVDSDVNSTTVDTDTSSGVDVGMGAAADIDANTDTDADANVNADADTGTNNTDTTTSTGPILDTNTVSQPENGILGTEPVTVEIQIVDGDGDATEDANKDSNSEFMIATTESGQDDVGVPELGKESGNQKWVALPLMLAGATAAIVGWWFLFFGKKKSKKERKEEK
ncbi:hypothetical protein IJ098_02335 [Candidatus Saccharibacteria bacterium]|nr:hypothetical protein [Candidatus Saccharibacteria bacterium]